MSTETNKDTFRASMLSEINKIQEELKNLKQDIVKKSASKKKTSKKKESKQKLAKKTSKSKKSKG